MNSFKGYVYRQKLKESIEKKRKQQKSQERNVLLTIFAIFTLFIFAMLNDSFSTNNSEYQEQSCVEKHKKDYQAYLYCERIKNFNH